MRNNFLQKLPQPSPASQQQGGHPAALAQGLDGSCKSSEPTPGDGQHASNQDGAGQPSAEARGGPQPQGMDRGAVQAGAQGPGQQRPALLPADVLASLDWPPEPPSLAEILPPVPAIDEDEEEQAGEEEQGGDTRRGAAHTGGVQPGIHSRQQGVGSIGQVVAGRAGGDVVIQAVPATAANAVADQGLEDGECRPEIAG